jgi:hypothetical protein
LVGFSFGSGSVGFGHSGSAPEPFDALNGGRLAGGQGSHPLHDVRPEELLRASDGGPITGQITTAGPVVVGQTITGSIALQVSEAVNARGAALRLIGLRLDEERRSAQQHDGRGNLTSSEYWVECHGQLFAADSFTEPAIPATLAAGASWQAQFAIPAPGLGPPTAHLGESIIAWAIETRWDIPLGSDHFLALYLPVAQSPDLLRAGVGEQGGASLEDELTVGDATITVTSPLPAPAGSDLVVQVRWPSAPHGDRARLELHRRTNAPNGVEGIIATVPFDSAALVGGTGDLKLTVPPGSPPSFDGAGLEITYILRALVDRAFRPDAAIERPVGIY